MVIENVKIKYKVIVKTSQFERLEVESDKSLFIRQSSEARNALRELLLNFLEHINVLFKTGAPNNRAILNERSNVSYKRSF